MSSWLVTKGNDQFTVDGLDELEGLTRRGELRAGDMVQPPGTDEWLYVSDIQELAEILAERGGSGGFDDDIDTNFRSNNVMPAIAGVLAVLIVVGGIAIAVMLPQLGQQETLLGDGGLTYSQMMITETGSGLRSVPEASASLTVPVKKDAVLELLSKRGDFYRARTTDGREGWVPTDHVIPMYQLGSADVQEKYDPLYNPERYIEVANARWMQLPDERGVKLTNRTNFEFMFRNNSQYPMTDLVIEATVKDAKGQTIDTVEIEVSGIVPPDDQTMIGTLRVPDEDALTMTEHTFIIMEEKDAELTEFWTTGAEVVMDMTEPFTNADIQVVELRAIPDADASQIVRAD
ncbi:MAG: hypothetical protein AAGA48_33005 [Myxococcota bacterium]